MTTTDNAVTGNDDAAVTLTDVAPAISVVKTADPVSLPEPGGDVAFHVKVTNTSASSDPLRSDVAVDDMFGNLSTGRARAPVPPVTLRRVGRTTCSFTGAVAGNAGGTHMNVVTASGHDDDGQRGHRQRRRDGDVDGRGAGDHGDKTVGSR